MTKNGRKKNETRASGQEDFRGLRRALSDKQSNVDGLQGWADAIRLTAGHHRHSTGFDIHYYPHTQ